MSAFTPPTQQGRLVVVGRRTIVFFMQSSSQRGWRVLLCGFVLSTIVLAPALQAQVGAPARVARDETEAARPFPVTIEARADAVIGEMRPVWRFFGYDEPNYTYMRDGRKLLSELAALSPVPVYIRAHNLLTSGDGTPALKWGSTGVYSEDANGQAHYDWTILDRIFDTYHERGIRPLVEIGFMPEALSARPEPYQHHWRPGGREPLFTGWTYPPRDYQKWAELVHQWVRHCVARYGEAAVAQWYWEVWNEPNIGYWHGTPEEYYKLYDYAADAVKRALPSARVGGPHSTSPRSGGAARFLRNFLEHCLHGTNFVTGQTGSPLDYVGFHAKGDPKYVDGHVRMGLSPQLQDVNRGFEIVASFPELKGKPVIIGESDPDGCAGCPSSVYPERGYRNGPHYASYTAAAFARKYLLADRHQVDFEGAVTWAFEFEDQPLFEGFRVLATGGIDLPVLNVFRMFGMMGGQRLRVTSSGDAGLDAILAGGVRDEPDVSALASRRDGTVAVLVWHYHDDQVPGPDADVQLTVSGLPAEKGKALVEHYRIDTSHTNPYALWKQMGEPRAPTPDQYAAIEAAGQLSLLASPVWRSVRDGRIQLNFRLPRQGVSLVKVDFHQP